MFADVRKPSAAAFLDHAACYYRDLGEGAAAGMMPPGFTCYRAPSFVLANRDMDPQAATGGP